MASKRINEGGLLEIPSASTARTSGDVVTYNSDTIGIVADTVASGAEYRAFVSGCWELAKNTGVTLSVGEDVYWASSELTTIKTAGTRIGVAARAASTTAAKGRVLLNHPNVQLVPQT